MMDAGMIVMTAFISPFQRERQMARELIGEDNFVEVYVSTSLEICEQRDVKGLYKKRDRDSCQTCRASAARMSNQNTPRWKLIQAEI
jgi:adenylylsulfate kinase-like enzyme